MDRPLTAWLPAACAIALSLTTRDAHADEGSVVDFDQQLTGDSGAGTVLGDFKSSRYAIGPQVGWFFPVGSAKGDVESAQLLGIRHGPPRPEGWNVWLTFVISPAAAPISVILMMK